jgi:uncharacterized repeat protein (TIGR02543 family)
MWHLNGGTLWGQKTSYTIEDDFYTLPTPQRSGHTFQGWFSNSNFTGGALTSIPLGSTGNRTFVARWEIITFLVTFYRSGAIQKEIHVPYGLKLSDFSLLNPQTRQTVDVYSNAEYTTAFNLDTPITSPVALFVNSNLEIFNTLTYSVNGQRTTETLAYNSPLNNLKRIEQKGYSFDGWFYDVHFTRPVLASDRLTANIEIFAKLTELPPARMTVGQWFASYWWIFLVVGLVGIGVLVFLAIAKKKGWRFRK